MRIAVVGPQNTGKSTFVRDFLDAFPHYTTPEKAHHDHVKALGLPLNQNATEESQRLILENLFRQIMEHPGDNIIFDRCVIDNFAYTQSAFLKGSVSKEFVLMTKRKVFEHLVSLDCILFIPTAAGVKLEESSLRDIDADFVDLINRMFMETLLDISARTHIPVFVITGNREQRIKLIKNKIL